MQPSSAAVPNNRSANGADAKKKGLAALIGPGLLTGASDDDPSGIGTYSQVGAQFGYGMLWTMLFSYPLMVAAQLICARIGRVTGKGLAGNLREHYPRWALYPLVLLLLAANTINIGADLGAMGASLHLLLPGPAGAWTVAFGVTCVVLEVLVPYHRYVRVLKWLTVALFAYVATAFAVDIHWGQVLHATFLPRLSLNRDYVTAIVAIFGTTISPYLFFWQASQEVEDNARRPAAVPRSAACPRRRRPGPRLPATPARRTGRD